MNYVRALQNDPSAKPENYWRNTSHNGIIRSFIEWTDLAVHDKFERLLSGECIQEQIPEDMTYDTLHSSEANLWSILYLTQSKSEDGKTCLKIPNEEIKTVFADTVASWFTDEVGRMDRKPLFDTSRSGNDKGLGRPDLVVRDRKNRRIIMIEIKYSGSENQMLCDCGSAIQQINIKQYANQFLKGYQVVLCYGIAFFGKQCLVKSIQSN